MCLITRSRSSVAMKEQRQQLRCLAVLDIDIVGNWIEANFSKCFSNESGWDTNFWTTFRLKLSTLNYLFFNLSAASLIGVIKNDFGQIKNLDFCDSAWSGWRASLPG
jgi:hypothetical protein